MRSLAPPAPPSTRVFDSPIGPLHLYASDAGICALHFDADAAFPHQPASPARTAHLDQLADELAGYFAGTLRLFTTPLDIRGTPFQQRVWNALLAIPCGQTRSYADIARASGNPAAVRAVGLANGSNPIALVIPCHRVIGSSGKLVGYGGELWRKQWLLDHERRMAGTPSDLFESPSKSEPVAASS